MQKSSVDILVDSNVSHTCSLSGYEKNMKESCALFKEKRRSRFIKKLTYTPCFHRIYYKYVHGISLPYFSHTTLVSRIWSLG